MMVWGVWTEDGEYENYANELQGLFATAELAESFADLLRAETDRYGPRFDSVEVIAQTVMGELPTRGYHHTYAAHINADGTEDHGSGFKRNENEWPMWLIDQPAVQSKMVPWNREGDRYIEATGTDLNAVRAAYAERLAEARAWILKNTLAVKPA